MAFDLHKNFAVSTVAVAPIPASSGTALTVATGDGTNFPAASFDAVVWPTATNPTVTNAEVVRVTAKATDVFTITRTAESSSARTIVAGDQIMAGLTAKTIKDIEDFLNSGSLTSHGVLVGNGTGAIAATAAGTAGQPLRSGGASADPSFVAITTGTVLNSSPGNITFTASSSRVMFGLAGSITPVSSGIIHVTICGTVQVNNTGSTFTVDIRYGTGSAPTNGAAGVGTQAALVTMQEVSSNKIMALSLTSILSGQTLNTALWLDLSVQPSGSVSATFIPGSLTISAFEL